MHNIEHRIVHIRRFPGFSFTIITVLLKSNHVSRVPAVARPPSPSSEPGSRVNLTTVASASKRGNKNSSPASAPVTTPLGTVSSTVYVFTNSILARTSRLFIMFIKLPWGLIMQVDPAGVAGGTILTDSGDVYDVMLSCVDLAKNSDKYYRLQVGGLVL